MDNSGSVGEGRTGTVGTEAPAPAGEAAEAVSPGPVAEPPNGTEITS